MDQTSQAFEDGPGVLTEEILEGSLIDTQDDIPIIRLMSKDEMPSEAIIIADVFPLGEDNLSNATTAIPVAEAVVHDPDIECGELSLKGYRRAEFVSAAFMKPEVATSLGFELCRETPMISAITDGSLANQSPLKEGDRLFSINKKHCFNMSSASIRKLLQTLTGTVEIVVHNEGGSPNFVESMVTKSHPNEFSGVVLRKSARGKLLVSSFREGHLFVHSLLNKGDELIAINGIDCREISLEDAARIIKETPRYITVVARTYQGSGVVVAELSKRDKGSGSTRTLQGVRLSTDRGSLVIPPNKAKFSTGNLFACAALVLIFVSLGIFVWVY